jgi:hypothetical protein
MAKRKYKFGGVNNVLDSAEVNERRDRFAPYTEMVSGNNIDISDRLAVRRRAGQTGVNSMAGHSLWATADGKRAYFVYNFGLYELNSDYSETLITVVASNAPMAFEEVNTAIVFMNGVDSGCLINGALSATPSTAKTGRMPTVSGTHLGFFHGRLLVGAPDGVLYYTDPHDLDYMEEDNCRVPLGGAPTMVEAVDGGVWVSTATTLVFLAGDDAGSFEWQEQGDYPCIAGASMRVPTKKLRLELPGEYVAVWASTNGVCLGTAKGQLINLSEERYSYAPGQRGAIMLRESEGLVHIVASIAAPQGSLYNKTTTEIVATRTALN